MLLAVLKVWPISNTHGMTHAPRSCAINRLHFLAPVFGAGFSYHNASGMKFLALKINVAVGDVNDNFCTFAIITTLWAC